MTYQRYMCAPLDDLLDQIIENAVEGTEVGRRDGDEEDRHRGCLNKGVAVGPLDFLELGPAGGEKAEDAAALTVARSRLLALRELLALAALAVGAFPFFGFLRLLGLGAALSPV